MRTAKDFRNALTPQQRAVVDAYAPCRSGLHVCGITADEANFYTERNLPLPAYCAQSVFDAAKAELAEPDDGDFVVDLMIGGDSMEDFHIRRQMLDRLTEIVAEARP